MAGFFFDGSIRDGYGTFTETDGFIVEVDKVKQIIRQTYLSDASRKEDDAEHSWHLALMAVLLSEYSNEEVDLRSCTDGADPRSG